MQLNREQQTAASHPIGEAALLLAGAGSGKTECLTHRVVNLIEWGVSPRRILVLTFTNKAADEIRKRVLKRTGLSEEDGPNLTTIHAFCLMLIRKNPQAFGLGERVTPLDEYDQKQVIKTIIERENKSRVEQKAAELEIDHRDLQEKIEYHRARGTGFAADYSEEVHKEAQKAHKGYHALEPAELAIWKLFEHEKRATSVIDFSDMIAFVNRRLVDDNEWKDRLQTMFDHVLQDESQDTNKPSWFFINNLLAPGNRNLYCVGDLSQSIYGFNGASPSLIKQFSEEWRGSPPALYRLSRNHRSVPEIVQLANAIQRRMTEALPLTMEAHRDKGGRQSIQIIRGDDPYNVAAQIASRVLRSGLPPKDHCILVRTHQQVREVETALVKARIPYVIRGSRGLLGSEEVRDILSYLRVAINPKDFASFSRAAGAPKRGIGDAALEKLSKAAKAQFGGDLVAAAAASTNSATRNLAICLQDIQKHTADPVQALKEALGMSSYRSHLQIKYAKDSSKLERKLENLLRLEEIIKAMAAEMELTTEDLIFQLTIDKVPEDDENGALMISTIHAAKGLEYPCVYLFGVIETVLPFFRCVTDSEIEEERRLFYVGITRARDFINICVPDEIQKFGGMVAARPSRFLRELGFFANSAVSSVA